MRKLFALAALAAATAAGCHMCDCPYDYCGPVVESHYAPEGAPMDDSEYSSARQPTPAQPRMADNGPTLNGQEDSSIGWVPAGTSRQ